MGSSNSLVQKIIDKIYDPSHKWKSDLWLLKWLELIFIIIDFHLVHTTPVSKIGIVIFVECLYFVYALLFTIFLRNKLSFTFQMLNLMVDFLAFTLFAYLSLSIFSGASRIYALFLIPVIYCSYWFNLVFTLLFTTLVSCIYILLNYSILLADMEKFFIVSEITNTLAPMAAVYYLAALVVLLFKRKILKYFFVDVDQELKERAEKLEQEKEYTRTLLKDKIDGYIAIDEKGYVTDINKLACELFGYDEQEIYKQNVKNIYAPGEAARMIRAMKASPDGTIENFKTYVINNKDKERIPILVSAALLYDRSLNLKEELDNGRKFSTLGYFRDLRAEEIIDSIGREITFMKNENQLFTEIARSISSMLKAEVCSILIYNGTTDKLETRASFGMPRMLMLPKEKYEEKEGMDGYVFSTGRTLNVKNIDIPNKKIDRDTNEKNNINVKWDYVKNFAEYSKYKDFQNYLATPLRVQGEVYGIIKVLNKYLDDKELDQKGFRDNDKNHLERIANHCSILIEKIRDKVLFESISKICMELNERLDLPLEDFLKRIAGKVVQGMGFTACLIYIIEQGNQLKIKACQGLSGNYEGNDRYTLEIGEGIPGKAAETGSPIIIPDAGKIEETNHKDILKNENLKSMLAVPIKYQNIVIGVINCCTLRQHIFTQEEIQIVQKFAVYTAVAIQNRKRVQELLALNEIGAELVKPFQIEKLFDLILENAKERSGADSICIKKYDARKKEISTLRTLACEWYKKTKGHIRTISEDLISKAIKDGEPIFNNYKVESENLENIPEIDLLREIRSRMIVPIKIYGRVFGVLCLESKRENAFNEDHLLILSAFSNQAGAAIRNAEFFNKLQNVKKTFPQISELNMDIHEVLGKIVDTAAEVLETDILVLYQYDDRTKKIIQPPIYTGDIKYKEFMEDEAIYSDIPILFIISGESHYAEESQKDPIMTGKGKPLQGGIPSRFVFREDIVSSAGIVLKVGQEIVGVMFINYRTPHEFNADERQIIEIFSSYIAVAIQNVMHFRETKIADTMQTIGKIASNFAHKLKNDIGTINLYTDSLMDDIKPTQPNYYPLSQIKEKTSKIKEEIDHLQKASKIHLQVKKLIHIKDLIDELKCEIERELEMKKIGLVIKMPSKIPEILIDPMQIKLVL